MVLRCLSGCGGWLSPASFCASPEGAEASCGLSWILCAQTLLTVQPFLLMCWEGEARPGSCPVSQRPSLLSSSSDPYLLMGSRVKCSLSLSPSPCSLWKTVLPSFTSLIHCHSTSFLPPKEVLGSPKILEERQIEAGAMAH